MYWKFFFASKKPPNNSQKEKTKQRSPLLHIHKAVHTQHHLPIPLEKFSKRRRANTLTLKKSSESRAHANIHKGVSKLTDGFWAYFLFTKTCMAGDAEREKHAHKKQLTDRNKTRELNRAADFFTSLHEYRHLKIPSIGTRSTRVGSVCPRVGMKPTNAG